MERAYKSTPTQRLRRQEYYWSHRERILAGSKARRRACAEAIGYGRRGGHMSAERRAELSQRMRQMWAQIRGGR